MPELVSTIIPTYNRAALLVRALDSVAAQAYRPIEVVIIDDGSTDNTVETVASRRPYLAARGIDVIFHQQQNQKAPKARNVGMKLARGSLFAFLDSDDLWLPDFLETVVRLLDEHPECGMGFSGILGIDDNDVVFAERRMYLDRGRAFFKVAHDRSRPFVVTAAGRTVTALGTEFDVRVGPGEFEVTLVQGKVRVEQPRLFLPPAHTAELKAGYRIEARNDRDWVVKPADVARDTGWVQGRLTFVDQPLAEVAAEMNRYSDNKIVMTAAAVGRQPVVALLKPGDLDSFVKMVRNYNLGRVTQTEDSIEVSPLTPQG